MAVWFLLLLATPVYYYNITANQIYRKIQTTKEHCMSQNIPALDTKVKNNSIDSRLPGTISYIQLLGEDKSATASVGS